MLSRVRALSTLRCAPLAARSAIFAVFLSPLPSRPAPRPAPAAPRRRARSRRGRRTRCPSCACRRTSPSPRGRCAPPRARTRGCRPCRSCCCAPAIMKLAASRFTSYSNGPGSVSSKSLRSNSSVRSGEAKTPKFDRWASPHSCTSRPAVGVSCQVGRHDLRRAPVERERRDQHPPVPHRHEVGLAGGVLRLEQRDRVGPVVGRAPVTVARSRCTRSSFQSACLAFVDARPCAAHRHRDDATRMSARVITLRGERDTGCTRVRPHAR